MFGEGGASLSLFSSGSGSGESSLSPFPFAGEPTAPVTPSPNTEGNPSEAAQEVTDSSLVNEHFPPDDTDGLNLVPPLEAGQTSLNDVGPAVSSDGDVGNILSDDAKGVQDNVEASSDVIRQLAANSNSDDLTVSAADAGGADSGGADSSGADVMLDVVGNGGNGANVVGDGNVSNGDGMHIGETGEAAEAIEAGNGRVDVG